MIFSFFRKQISRVKLSPVPFSAADSSVYVQLGPSPAPHPSPPNGAEPEAPSTVARASTLSELFLYPAPSSSTPSPSSSSYSSSSSPSSYSSSYSSYSSTVQLLPSSGCPSSVAPGERAAAAACPPARGCLSAWRTSGCFSSFIESFRRCRHARTPHGGAPAGLEAARRWAARAKLFIPLAIFAAALLALLMRLAPHAASKSGAILDRMLGHAPTNSYGVRHGALGVVGGCHLRNEIASQSKSFPAEVSPPKTQASRYATKELLLGSFPTNSFSPTSASSAASSIFNQALIDKPLGSRIYSASLNSPNFVIPSSNSSSSAFSDQAAASAALSHRLSFSSRPPSTSAASAKDDEKCGAAWNVRPYDPNKCVAFPFLYVTFHGGKGNGTEIHTVCKYTIDGCSLGSALVRSEETTGSFSDVGSSPSSLSGSDDNISAADNTSPPSLPGSTSISGSTSPSFTSSPSTSASSTPLSSTPPPASIGSTRRVIHLRSLRGMLLATDGQLFVGDGYQGDSKIVLFSDCIAEKQGKRSARKIFTSHHPKLNPGLVHPYGLARFASFLYVSAQDTGEILRFELTSARPAKVPASLKNKTGVDPGLFFKLGKGEEVRGIAVDGSGNLYISNKQRGVLVVDSRGYLRHTIPVRSPISVLFQKPRNSIWVRIEEARRGTVSPLYLLRDNSSSTHWSSSETDCERQNSSSSISP
eukprot:GHVT01072382.1.p1 GENE.GHVT01072382.1~~GHVT01072382.1.p1  ORF type:complete len:701 (-),score=146.20 GHVT01072382.1:524-2626(-)